MVLAVLPMVELVGIAEGVHDGLEERFQNLQVAIYSKSIHKKNQEASSKITTQLLKEFMSQIEFHPLTHSLWLQVLL